ncbi:MAG: hypothetical protein NPIRA05_05650 [Nitrospirales bacterium]|nr:MAG: hypothetical protein NPIRA05_05650 [Nitrospirales bacterium]
MIRGKLPSSMSENYEPFNKSSCERPRHDSDIHSFRLNDKILTLAIPEREKRDQDISAIKDEQPINE